MQRRTSQRHRPPARTLGPVSDLERHLPADWWQTLFNSLYLKTDGDVVENAEATKHDVDLLIEYAGLEQNDRILDLCCGQGRHSIELAQRGFRHVTGIDRSRYLVRLARQRAKQLGLDIVFREGDARRIATPAEPFNGIIVMGNSFGYFEREEDDVAILESIKQALSSRGVLTMDLADGAWMRENYEPRSWEWTDQNHFVCRERALSNDGQRLICREVVVHAERGVIADQFYAERLYDRADLLETLERLGFSQIRFHDAPQTLSERNVDLGFLTSRLFLTAEGPTKEKRKRRGPPIPEVAVVLGDPRLPDAVKLNGRFNSEDLETVAKLKGALAELEEYRFDYFDNHASLWQSLRAARPKFVLNLCDEGYNNDATLELHVPALLEMLAVPYSGSGPVSLGLCYDKSLVRSVAESLEIRVPLETFCGAGDQAATLPAIFPALIKPNLGDSSIGITAGSIVHSPEQAVDRIDALHRELPGRALLVQEFLTGPEYSVGLIGNPGYDLHALPILEVDYEHLDDDLPRILGYESKWDPASPYWTQIRYCPAEVDDSQRRRLIDYSLLLFERLGCRDYARFDFRCTAEGDIRLLEVNPNPGWCWDGKLNLMAGFEGLRYADLLRMIIETAQTRVVGARASRAAALVAPAA